MNKKQIITIIKTIVVVIITTIIFILLMKACTSPEMWYAGFHDKQCEIMLTGGDYEQDSCGCYERLLEADRNDEFQEFLRTFEIALKRNNSLMPGKIIFQEPLQ